MAPRSAVPSPAAAPRPAHLRAGAIALVLVGGTLGTAAREGVSLVLGTDSEFPLGTLAVNLLGAFLLGLLLEALARRGAHEAPLTHLRLLLGTGFMGGFTTYSTLALDAAQMLGSGAPALGAVYLLGSVIAGGIAALAGIAVAAALRPDAGAESCPEADSDLMATSVAGPATHPSTDPRSGEAR
ncbi:CrcB family protein [Kocuria sp. p3-SID1433]|uniref:fluoride efflux transporter FluC n=1 Tax=unclassified Kocuria TaxID=2649579 RepID=UPI0021A8D918|nr:MULTISPECIES: CrcB family protein [unclassified Kocuria]MCT1602951.1 CrcB family protein [Kocuria sp. p3-SID1428]MCT2180671.1 CrcB family protein [Kocuria sp. p3-SID1433]